MSKSISFLCLFLACISVSGCTSSTKQYYSEMVAVYSQNIVVDGNLNEEVWTHSPKYNLSLPGKNAKPQESSQIQAAWDDNYFYLAGTFVDSDIVAEGLEDGLHQYQFGDVCELFLKPVDYSWYWELYGTPLGKKTTFWFPGQGRLGLPSSFGKYTSGLKVAAINRGTVNEWQDYDEGWTIEMAIPIKDLTAHGEKFGSDSGWRILIGRYNYSRYLENKGPELSAFPKLSQTDFHLLNEYAVLKLQR